MSDGVASGNGRDEHSVSRNAFTNPSGDHLLVLWPLSNERPREGLYIAHASPPESPYAFPKLSTTMAAPLQLAEQLKTEGNALFVKNDFTGAYQKYTEAIKHDKKNAILYCNRAACAFGLNRYRDPDSTRHEVSSRIHLVVPGSSIPAPMRLRFVQITDNILVVLTSSLVQATELDPSYAKAWSRLAQAQTVGHVQCLCCLRRANIPTFHSRRVSTDQTRRSVRGNARSLPFRSRT